MIEKEELLKMFGEKIGEPDGAGNYEKLGISTRTLDTYVDAISKMGVEEVKEGFVDAHLTILESMGGQLRKEKADFAKAYKTEIEAQQNDAQKDAPKEDLPPEQATETPKENDELKAIQQQLAKVLELNNTLSQRLDAMETSAKNTEVAQAVADAMRAKGATDAYVLKNVLKKLQLQEGQSAEEMAESMMGAYDEELKECRGSGAMPRNGASASASSDELASYFAKKFAKKFATE